MELLGQQMVTLAGMCICMCTKLQQTAEMNAFYFVVYRGVILKLGFPGETSLGSYKNQGLVLKTVLRIAIDF